MFDDDDECERNEVNSCTFGSQGDQIGRIFAILGRFLWAVFMKITGVAQIFGAPCAFPPPQRSIFSDYSFLVHHLLNREDQ
jgi:hypothetical protein